MILRMSLVLLIVCGTLTVSPALGQEDRNEKLTQSKQAYDKREWDKSKAILEQLVLTYPKDTVVHYLLANTYMAAGKLELAEREYDICVKLNCHSTMKAQCIHAIHQIKNYNSAQSATAATPSAAPATALQSASAATSAAPYAAPSVPALVIDPTLALNEEKLSEQEQEFLRRHSRSESESTRHERRIADTQINRIKADADFEIAQIRKYIYNDHHEIKNPSYESDTQAIREYADKRIKAILDAQERNNLVISRNANRAKTDTTNMASNLREAAQSEKGSIRVMPNGSNLYTKNYVNFDEESEPDPPELVPLKAEYRSIKAKAQGKK